MKCPDGLLWNQDLLICDWNSNCNVDGRSKHFWSWSGFALTTLTRLWGTGPGLPSCGRQCTWLSGYSERRPWRLRQDVRQCQGLCCLDPPSCVSRWKAKINYHILCWRSNQCWLKNVYKDGSNSNDIDWVWGMPCISATTTTPSTTISDSKTEKWLKCKQH